MKKLIWGVAVAVLPSVTQAITVHVDDDAPPGGDGLSWETPYRFLQDALFEAAGNGTINEIRVAQGTYVPDQDEAGNVTPGDREATFQLPGGVAVLGGFAGLGAPDPDERDIALYETVLSGDLLGDDLPDFANNGENSYHVVKIDDAVGLVLDGVTIRGGNAGAEAAPNIDGAGMYVSYSTFTVSRCLFTENSAAWGGGGMYHRWSSASIEDCIFVGNRSLRESNTGGGGLVNMRGEAFVRRCEFRDNQGALGGAVACAAQPEDMSVVTMVECLMTDNTAGLGGGGVFAQNLTCVMVNCAIMDNNVVGGPYGYGGGLFNQSQSSVKLANCVVTGNSAPTGGGGLYVNSSGVLTVTNCTISANTSVEGGGGIALYNVTGSVEVRNSILWNNAVAGIADEPAQITAPADDGIVNYTCIEGLTGVLGGVGNIGDDPLFVDAGSGDFRLGSGSPCADAGHNWAVASDEADLDDDGDTAELTPIDLDGNPRFADGPVADTGCGLPVVVDMGAYEYQGDPFSVKLGDIDGDGVVGVNDFLLLVAAWGACTGDCCLPDLDLDGDVGVADFLILLAHWG